MNTQQVTESLQTIFASERIVFWNDPNNNFLSLFDNEMFSPVENVTAAWPENEADITAFLDKLKAELKAALERGERIQIK